MRISSADWFKAGVARQRVGPISLGIAPRACTILSKLLLLLLLCVSVVGGVSRKTFTQFSKREKREKRETLLKGIVTETKFVSRYLQALRPRDLTMPEYRSNKTTHHPKEEEEFT